MKRYLPLVLILFLGSTGGLGFGAEGPLPLSGGAAAAQARGERFHGDDKDDKRDDHHHDDDRHHDHDRKFDDHDRQAAHDYYEHHRNERGFRDRDRLSPEYESRFREGYVIEPELRKSAYPAPHDLIHGMAPPPPGYRYVVIGGHVVMVDHDYRVHDSIHLELNFGH